MATAQLFPAKLGFSADYFKPGPAPRSPVQVYVACRRAAACSPFQPWPFVARRAIHLREEMAASPCWSHRSSHPPANQGKGPHFESCPC